MLHTSELLAVAIFVSLVGLTFACAIWLCWRLARRRPVRAGPFRRRWLRVITHALAALGTGCILYGWLWEANALALTRPELAVPGWPASDSPLQLLHLTDHHLEGRARRIERLLAMKDQVAPQIVCHTGDYLNDRGSLELLEEIGGAFRGTAGTFAVGGNWDRTGPDHRGLEALARAGVRVLRDERVAVQTDIGTVQVVGVDYPAQDGWQRLIREAPGGPMIVLYHSSDLVERVRDVLLEEGAPRRPAVYLCGHTHGGQVRLPLYGALLTLAFFGKKYEMGAYAVGPVTLYVSRGIGMEAGIAPRVRFLCPPEAALIEVVPK